MVCDRLLEASAPIEDALFAVATVLDDEVAFDDLVERVDDDITVLADRLAAVPTDTPGTLSLREAVATMREAKAVYFAGDAPLWIESLGLAAEAAGTFRRICA